MKYVIGYYELHSSTLCKWLNNLYFEQVNNTNMYASAEIQWILYLKLAYFTVTHASIKYILMYIQILYHSKWCELYCFFSHNLNNLFMSVFILVSMYLIFYLKLKNNKCLWKHWAFCSDKTLSRQQLLWLVRSECFHHVAFHMTLGIQPNLYIVSTC